MEKKSQDQNPAKKNNSVISGEKAKLSLADKNRVETKSEDAN